MDLVHLYDSDGRWIAWYRRGLPYVWGVHGAWLGWFPWSSGDQAGDVLDPSGQYLGTVVRDRLWSRSYHRPAPPPRRVPEPQRPTGLPDVAGTTPRPPPPGFADVARERLRGGGPEDFAG